MEENEYNLSAPEKGKWTPHALAKWESKVTAEIDSYLAIPCPYYGPDLEFPIQGKHLVNGDRTHEREISKSGKRPNC